MATNLILTLTCTDKIGIVSTVSTFLLDHECNIAESNQYWDQSLDRFFMRVVFVASKDENLESLTQKFQPIANHYHMNWQLTDANKPMKTMILVSKFDHCLNDLMYRVRTNILNLEITAVVSNHEDSREIVEERGHVFHYLPVNKDNKMEQEQKLWTLVQQTDSELVILARYMQILSDGLCQKLKHRAINIHHSFLPSFKGANPYSRAYDRGVKLIGATAHYVTADLDEGPIIEQEVTRVNHNYDAQQLVLMGRDVECQTLARAVKYHSEHRVLIHGRKTVVFQ